MQQRPWAAAGVSDLPRDWGVASSSWVRFSEVKNFGVLGIAKTFTSLIWGPWSPRAFQVPSLSG